MLFDLTFTFVDSDVLLCSAIGWYVHANARRQSCALFIYSFLFIKIYLFRIKSSADKSCFATMSCVQYAVSNAVDFKHVEHKLKSFRWIFKTTGQKFSFFQKYGKVQKFLSSLFLIRFSWYFYHFVGIIFLFFIKWWYF